MKSIATLFVFGCFNFVAFAQTHTFPEINASTTTGDIDIDGVLTESDWINANIVSGFWTNFPADTALATGQTFVRLLFDNEFIYIGARCKNGTANHRYVASSLRRDYPFVENDAFGVVLDTYLDQTNGYGFYVSAYGATRRTNLHRVNNGWDMGCKMV
jgi:hypothetical protein